MLPSRDPTPRRQLPLKLAMVMDTQSLPLTLTFATREDDLRAAERLRYKVFVEELGGAG